MPSIVTKSPTILECKILKWILLPIFLLGVLFLIYNQWLSARECQELCDVNGYIKAMHIPSDRVGSEAKCICTEPIETNSKSVKLIIPMDN